MKNKPEATVFSKRLLELRKERGLSQPELGRMIGTSAAIIGRYERGMMTPSVDVARKLAQALGVTADYLITGRDLPAILRDQEMVERWRAVDEFPSDDQERIVFVLDSLIRETRTRLAYRKSA